MEKYTKKQLIEMIKEYSRDCDKQAAKEKSEPYKFYMLGKAEAARHIVYQLERNTK